MTQQEIKNGMTQGVWVETRTSHIQSNNDKGDFVADCGFMNNTHPAYKYNTQAITTAINNTYGNNIDPTKIGEMYKLLEECACADCMTFDLEERLNLLVKSVKLK